MSNKIHNEMICELPPCIAQCNSVPLLTDQWNEPNILCKKDIKKKRSFKILHCRKPCVVWVLEERSTINRKRRECPMKRKSKIIDQQFNVIQRYNLVLSVVLGYLIGRQTWLWSPENLGLSVSCTIGTIFYITDPEIRFIEVNFDNLGFWADNFNFWLINQKFIKAKLR